VNEFFKEIENFFLSLGKIHCFHLLFTSTIRCIKGESQQKSKKSQ